MAKRKMGEATHLLRTIDEYIGHLGNIVTKAKLFNEAITKLGSPSGSNVMHIVVDYSAKMKILEEMQTLMVGLHTVPIQLATLLKLIPGTSKGFLELPAAEIFQGLLIPTKLVSTNPKSSRLDKPTDLTSNARWQS